MITRRHILITTGITLLAAPFSSIVQAQKKIPRVGYLSLSTPERDKEWLEAFRQGLRELGYVEGSNLELEVRHAAGIQERFPGLAAELIQRKVQVVVTYGLPAVTALSAADRNLPIVMTVSADPTRLGLAKSLARPGGQVTGFTDLHSGLASKRLQMLKEIVPSVSRVAVIINPAATQLLPQLDDLKAASASMGMTLVVMPIKGPTAEDVKRAYAAIARERPNALMVIPDPTIDRSGVTALSIEHRLPSIGTVKEWAEAGFLISYGTSFADLWRRSATYVDKILKGAKPGDLPIEQPTKFELVINIKTAKLLGVKLPNSILVQADKVIE